MKKIIFSGLLAIPFLGIALAAGATTTSMSIPSIGDLLGYVLDVINPFLTAFWPIIGLLVGIGILGALIGRITNRF